MSNLEILFMTILFVAISYLLINIIKKYFGYSARLHRNNIKNSYKVLENLKYFKQQGKNNGYLLGYLRNINHFLFEEVILTAYKEKGYKIIRNKRYTGDGGSDGIVFINNQKYFIQAKRYSNSISKKAVDDLGLLVNKKKAKGLFIHTGKTPKTIKEYFDINNDKMVLVSGDNLIDLLILKD